MSERLTTLRAALTARLERVRGSLTDAEFARLIDDVMRTAERLEEIEAGHRGGTTRVASAPLRATLLIPPTEPSVAEPRRDV
jgi:hypothetical protein